MPQASESNSNSTALPVNEEVLRTILNKSRSPIFVKNRQHQILLVNDALCELVGLTRDQILGKTDQQLYAEDEAKVFYEIDEKVFRTQQPIEIEEVITSSDHVTKILHTTKTLFTTSTGEQLLLGTIHDISELRAAQNKLEDAVSHLSMVALTDSLTGLSNREQIESDLGQQICLSTENQSEFSVLFMDLNGFKAINDTAGHQVGDEILKITAGRLKNLLRSNAKVARIGGDEFLILLPEADEQQASYVIDRIVDCFKVPIKVKHSHWPVASSIGVAVFPRDGSTGPELIRNADLAMYTAKKEKEKGPKASSTVQFFRSKIGCEMERRQQLEHALLRTDGGIQQSYQPIVGRDEDGLYRIRGFESLARWEFDGKIVSPEEFIPILERGGGIVDFGYKIIESACQQLVDNCTSDQFISVNLTYKQILETNFCEVVGNILRQMGVKAHRLALELDEQDANIKSRLATAVFEKLARIGVQTVLDDFGAGYSNIARLGSFSVDIVKIDKSLITGDQRILRSVLRMLQELELTTIVEGVETEKHLEIAEALSPDMLQGYLFGRPEAADFDWSESVLTRSVIA